MKNFKLLMLIAVVTVFSACSSVRVSSDYDQDANFNEYKSFAFFKPGIDKAEISDLPPVILKESEWTLPEIPAGTRKWKLEGGIIGNRTEEDIGSSYQKGMNISLVVTIILWVIVILLLFLPSEILRILKEIIG